MTSQAGTLPAFHDQTCLGKKKKSLPENNIQLSKEHVTAILAWKKQQHATMFYFLSATSTSTAYSSHV